MLLQNAYYHTLEIMSIHLLKILKLIVIYLYRCPFLLDVLMTVATGHLTRPSVDSVGPIITVYGVLLFNREQRLSVYQRLLTLLAVKGNANYQVNTLQSITIYI